MKVLLCFGLLCTLFCLFGGFCLVSAHESSLFPQHVKVKQLTAFLKTQLSTISGGMTWPTCNLCCEYNEDVIMCECVSFMAPVIKDW
jgi:hypothetical protein